MAQATVDAAGIMQNVTLEFKIKHFKQLRWRIRVGCQLLQLAARVMGCGIEIDTEAEAPSHCDHAVGLTGWGTLWHISDGPFPDTERMQQHFGYCPHCGATLKEGAANDREP